MFSFGGAPYGKEALGMDDKNFKHWFQNVFWYHYKWHVVIGGIALFMAIAFIHDVATNTQPDFQVIIASTNPIADDQMSEINQTLQDAVGDVNGDGKSYSYVVPISLNESDQMGYASTMKLSTLLSDDSIVLYVMDKVTADDYRPKGLFEPLENLGLTGTDGDEYYIRVDSLPVFERAGLKTISQEKNTSYLACFRRAADINDPKTQKSYAAAGKALAALIDKP